LSGVFSLGWAKNTRQKRESTMLPQANNAFAYVLDLFAHSGVQLKGGAIPNESIRTQDHILARP
jgi:hypothetical protein